MRGARERGKEAAKSETPQKGLVKMRPSFVEGNKKGKRGAKSKEAKLLFPRKNSN
jgi:hypothetical protein